MGTLADSANPNSIKIPSKYIKWITSGAPAKRHLNGVLLVCASGLRLYVSLVRTVYYDKKYF